MSDGASWPSPPESAADGEHEKFLESVCFHFILACEEGHPPDIDAYLARYPRHAEELARLLVQESAPPQLAPDPSRATRERHRGWAGHVIAGFDVLFHVSSAGGGHVYKAKRTDSDEEVALKVISRRETIDERDIERFRREAAVLAGHSSPHIGTVNEVIEQDDNIVIVMPWLEGATLEEVIAALRDEGDAGVVAVERLDLSSRFRIIGQVAAALATLHARGISHRDLKPANIMLLEDLEPVLIDFGVAGIVGDVKRLTQTRDAPLGTARYLAPELLDGDGRADPVGVDIYGIGMVLYEFVTLHPAFGALDRRGLFSEIRFGTVRSPRSFEPRLSARASSFILKVIARDPATRPATMMELKEMLENIDAAGRRGPTPVQIIIAAALAAAIVVLISILS